MQRKTLCRIVPALSLALGLLFTGCSGAVQPPDEEPGLLRIRLAAGDARTLVPDIPFARYDLTLSAEGRETIARSFTVAENPAVELAPVTWTVTVRGFAQAEDTTPIARGSLDVRIKSGVTETVTLPLGPIAGEGVGTLRYSISLPAGLSFATLTLSPLEEPESPPVDLLTAGGTGTLPGRAAGYYRLRLRIGWEALPLAGQEASLSEVVHIYDDAETAFTLPAEAALAWAYVPKPWLGFDHGRRVTDADAPQTQAAWEAQNTYYVPSGQSVVLAPLAGNIPQGAVYEWTIDNAPVHTGSRLDKAFTAASSLVKVAATVDALTHATASVLVKAVTPAAPRSGGTKAQAATCIEFSPAPGQFVGTGNGYSNPVISNLPSLTEEAVRNRIQSYLDGEIPFNNADVDGKVFSLGGWGGYYILGFDHSAPNGAGADLTIPSNHHVAHMNEPGVVWVSRDLNGDGKPNELWYQLKGSQDSPTRGYLKIYCKPRENPGLWLDNRGSAGGFVYYPNGNDGYPYHITGSIGTYVIFTGVLLQDSNLNGYVDAGTNEFDLDDAVDAAGNGVELDYIDFVKVQTGLDKVEGSFGECSTEAGIPQDLHFGG
jgi:hypothetical protein